MKKSLITIGGIVVFASFLSGVASAWYVVHLFSERAWESVEKERSVLGNILDQRYTEELLLSFGVGNIQLIRNQKYDEFYRINCFLIQSQLSRVYPERIKRKERRQELENKIGEAKELLKGLKKDGLCATTASSGTPETAGTVSSSP